MRFKRHTNRKGIWRVGLALAVFAVAVPSALATSYADRGAGSAVTLTAPGQPVQPAFCASFYTTECFSPPAGAGAVGRAETPLPKLGLAPAPKKTNGWVESMAFVSPEGLRATSGTGAPAQRAFCASFECFYLYPPAEAGAGSPAVGGQSHAGLSSPKAVEPGFQWDDAGIGAGVGLGLMLLGGAAVVATRHMRPIAS
jgi:hypothetical protein